jgi:hypothetical protein
MHSTLNGRALHPLCFPADCQGTSVKIISFCFCSGESSILHSASLSNWGSPWSPCARLADQMATVLAVQLSFLFVLHLCVAGFQVQLSFAHPGYSVWVLVCSGLRGPISPTHTIPKHIKIWFNIVICTLSMQPYLVCMWLPIGWGFLSSTSYTINCQCLIWSRLTLSVTVPQIVFDHFHTLPLY